LAKTKMPNATAKAEAIPKAEQLPQPSPSVADAAAEVDKVEAPPLAPEHVELLVALDRMLSTGSYYPPGHAQYDAVAEQCATALTAAMRGRPSLEIEVQTTGFIIDAGCIEKTERCARRLHDLLEPLNQALLEIHGAVTTEDLHQGLATLKSHHKQLAGTREYQEIEIEGMPETMTAVSRNLYVRTKAGNGPEKTKSPLNENFDPNTIPDAMLVHTPEGQMMEREFLAVIQGIMKNGDPTKLKALQNTSDEMASDLLGTWVPDDAISTIKGILDSLESSNTDPMMLQHLVGHAQEALQLTGDPALVELVFEKLRKEGTIKKKSGKLLENRPKPAKKPVRFTMSRTELRTAIDDVATDAEAVERDDDLVTPSGADCLGICIQILHAAPTDELAAGISDSIRSILGAEDVTDVEISTATNALAAIFHSSNSETTELVVAMINAPLRESHLERLGPFWLNIWQKLGSYKEKERAWPYVVNELLLGLQWENPRQKIELYQALSEINTTDRIDLMVKLESLRALQEKELASDMFHAPAPLLYNLHEMLMGSSLAEEHGPLLHQRLAYQKAHPLATSLVEGFGEYNQAHRAAYVAIMVQGISEKIVPALKDIAARHFRGALNRLTADRREEAWVPDAIGWLGMLDIDSSRPVIEKILKEKKFFFFPVWPANCRTAAQGALAGQSSDGERNHHGN
jgi:hypothetical protein